jgi:hypothetical protein
MLTRERGPGLRTVDRWAIELLLEAGAIHRCDHHGWAKDRTDPHAREEGAAGCPRGSFDGFVARRCLRCWNRSETPVQSVPEGIPRAPIRLSQRGVTEFREMAPRANWKGFLRLSLGCRPECRWNSVCRVPG